MEPSLELFLQSSLLDTQKGRRTMAVGVKNYLLRLRTYEDYLSQDPADVEKVSKIAHKLLGIEQSLLDDVLRNLYDLNMWGGEVLRANRYTNGSSKKSLICETDFFMHALQNSVLLYRITYDISRAEDWYYHARTAALAAEEFDLNLAAECMAIAGDGAFILSERTYYGTKKKWQKRAIDCYWH